MMVSVLLGARDAPEGEGVPLESNFKPCLFCGDAERPRIGEHVVPAGLGGSLTLADEVCEHCSTDIISPLDSAFVRYVHDIRHGNQSAAAGPSFPKPGAVERALAKSALLFLCKVLGSDLARNRAFDPVRRFVLMEHEDNRGFVDLLTPEDVDDYAYLLERFIKPGFHTLILDSVQEIPAVDFIIYQQPFGRVCLTVSPTGKVGPRDHAVGLLNYKEKSGRILTYRENLKELRQTFFAGK